MMSRVFRFLLLAGLIFSAGCSSLEPLLASLTPPTPVPTRTATATSTPPAPATATASVEPQDSTLRIWLPAQFNPAQEGTASELLAERLAEFETEYPKLKIEVRIKKAEAEGDLLNALSLTSAAAPSVLPDLVLLPRSDFEMAALLGLLHPIDGLSNSPDDPNWYSYAQQLGHVRNTGYGLPFLGDALVLVYYPELGQLETWEDVLKTRGHIAFPAGHPQGLIGLSLYASAGGDILDAEGLPILEQ